MSERKNIDRLFQEKFKDFEMLPSDKVWDNILQDLNNEKKTKISVLPFWLRLCGNAAVFLIGFAVATTFFLKPEGKNHDIPATVKTDTDSGTLQTGKNQNTPDTALFNENTSIATTEAVSEDIKTDRTLPPESAPAAAEGVQVKTHSQKGHDAGSEAVAHQQANSKSDSDHGKSENTNSQLVQDWSSDRLTNDVNPIAQQATANSWEDDKIVMDTANPNHENVEDLLYEDNSSKVAFEAGKGRYVKKEVIRTIPPDNLQIKEQAVADKPNSFVRPNEKTLVKTLTDKNAIVAKDSLPKAKGTSEQNPLDKILKEKEEIEKEDKKVKKETRWALAPKVSPIFMNASGSASTIDAQFDNNDKTYQTSFSYGLGVNYAVNKKITVRAGINKMNLQYDTNGILFYESKESRNLQHVRRNATGSELQIEDKDSRVMVFSGNSLVTEKTSGALNQKMGYIEVPLEVSYKLLNKKFGIEVIGGLSTMFLDENKITLVSANQEIVIGEAKNLNDIHLSSNVGLGFSYKFSKAFEAGFEPMFKYQINTYNDNPGDFKPYFFGLYTGLSYKF